jgi:antitoxin VapB
MRKTAKLFKNGQSQAVRLPKEFRFDGKEVLVERDGDRVVLSPLVNGMAGFYGYYRPLPQGFGEGGRS